MIGRVFYCWRLEAALQGKLEGIGESLLCMGQQAFFCDENWLLMDMSDIIIMLDKI